ncbi:G-type lectin S-receptor-like serine/threonine-protein kinase At2g19130 [Oryza brachyantha]|uniref:G-type lectin S-receptor-like serine/threonine-protein kinase At2g19130 n=1 Tax=Oryza brachyantha TaxID=4533 RepID=UPI001ADA4CBB|nr:G-type lectin S-receptor-like serine/threonine-protein kinase At2g19130 [Oryza brachyantha]
MAPLLHTSLGLLLLFLCITPTSSSPDDALRVGEVLAVGDKLVSRNGRFILGFFQPSIVRKSGINITSPNWYLGIWFSDILEFTVVWAANRDNPITELQLNQTHLKLSGDGNLVISSNASIIWSTNNGNRKAATMNTTSAILSNDGNLVIESSSNVLWQSFDNPSDVLLPGAKFGWNKVTGFTRRIISNKNLVDPSLGLYHVELGNRGVILTRREPPVVYWSWSSEKSTNEFMLISLLKQLIDINPHTRGRIGIQHVDNNEEEYYTYTVLDESYSIYVLLDVSGQVEINVWSHLTQSLQKVYAQPADPCTAYATCGPFTICNGISRPFCDCMASFSRRSPQDWELDDRTAGCVRNTPLDCGNMTSSTDVFHAIARVTLPYNPQIVDSAATQGKCAEACLGHCSCNAYSYGNSRCSIWHGDLLSVNMNDGIDNNSEDVLYLRLAAKDLPGLTKSKKRPIFGVVMAASITSFGLLMLLLWLIWRNKSRCCGIPSYDRQCSGGIVAFRYSELRHATDNFSKKLGGGGFGSVFKGLLSDSATVAVKKLDGARQGEKQFRAEVSSIGLIQHINLVKLIGFCCEGDERLLVYEHMLNGSLDSLLFQSNGPVLNWTTRYDIIIGVARGLSYLHQSCHECIIHCDIKPENILLDASFVPKITDFGMAAFIGRDFSRVLTTFRGTIGYLAPEWISGVAITPKVDVYSFGMVLLEILSGKRNAHGGYITNKNHVAYFPVLAISKLHKGDVKSLVDPQLHGDFDLEEARRVCKVASWCIQDNEFERPTMSEVVRVLEGLQELDMPPMPRLLAAITECSDVSQCGSSSILCS